MRKSNCIFPISNLNFIPYFNKIGKTIIPNSIILRKYIEFFYVLNTDNPFKFSYLAFPHYNTGLSFFKGATVNRNGFQVDIESAAASKIHIEILGKYKSPVLVHYNGPIQEVAIIFKPFGINRFIRENYHSIAMNFSQAYQNAQWEIWAKESFNSENSIQELETFLFSQLVESEEISNIEKSLPYFHHRDLNYAVSEIAQQTGYNLKSFQRHFTKHMGCSPVDYKRIVRFRNSIASRLKGNDFKSLTDITYENNYSDQSYFIKEFKRLTSHNPKKFFKEASLVDGDKIIWEIL